MTDLSELLELVKAATGPDRDLDHSLSKKFGKKNDFGVLIVADRWLGVAPFSENIDASLWLVRTQLPADASLVMKQHANGKYFHVEIETDEGDFTAYNHPSMPLAILSALLQALGEAP